MEDCPAEVGGVKCPSGTVARALDVLRSSRGMMVRQPLRRAGSPLAECDYHAVAAPYKERFSQGEVTGRGAAGRHITKQAFIAALEEILARLAALAPVRAVAPVVAQAWAAFSRDCTYAAEMAASAVGVLRERHAQALRAALQQAAHQAVSACEARTGQFVCDNPSPCGTGACRFAPRSLAFVTVVSVRGPVRRPANHTRKGAPWNLLDALPELAAAERFEVSPRPVLV